MVIRYPNGKAFQQVQRETTEPTYKKKDVSYSNRGKSLEDDLNETNTYYVQQGIANIHKKPVPVQIVKVEYPSRSAAVIREAYFRTPSTTDYNGVWNGYYIDFEAKETKNKASFPLQNIHAHQIAHMKAVEQQRGIAFFIIRFSQLERDFIVPFHIIEDSWQAMIAGKRKSIPLALIEQHGYEVLPSYRPRLDYISVIAQWITNA